MATEVSQVGHDARRQIDQHCAAVKTEDNARTISARFPRRRESRGVDRVPLVSEKIRNRDRAVAASGDRRRRHDRDRTRVDRIEEPVRIRADTYPYGAERTCVDHTGFVQRDRIPDQLERDGIQTRIAAAVAQGAAVRSSDEAYEIERVGDPTVIEKGTPRLSCHGDSRRYARS